MRIITVSAKAQHGKDLAAEILQEKLKDLGYRVLIIHFADYLKFVCRTYFGWNGEKDEKGRSLLQYIGTDKIRKHASDFHVDLVIRFLLIFESDYDYVIIPDTRFPNEILKPRLFFDVVSLHIERLNFKNDLTPEQRLHPTETALDGYKFDYYIKSPSGKEFLSQEIDKFIDFLHNAPN